MSIWITSAIEKLRYNPANKAKQIKRHTEKPQEYKYT